MGQEYQLDTQVGYILRRASQRHAAIFQRGAVRGLTATQFAALVRIAEIGTISQNRLGRLCAMDVATIKGVIDRLYKKGLVTLARDPDDKRRMLIGLTGEARGYLDELYAEGQRITEETLAPLTASEQRKFLKMLEKLC